MEPIPVPKELIVPLTVVMLATVTFLLRDINKGKPLGTQMSNVIQGLLGILAALWLVVNLMLKLTGSAWNRFLGNEYMQAFLTALAIDVSTMPEWVSLIIALVLFYLAIKFAAGAGASVWAKIGHILMYYIVFLLILAVVSPIIFSFMNTVLSAYVSNPAIQSLLLELGLLKPTPTP